LSHLKLLSIFLMMGLIFGTLAAVQSKLAASAFAQSQNVVCPTKQCPALG